MSLDFPRYKDTITKTDKLYRFCWRVTSLLLFAPFSLPIFNNWRIFMLRLFGAKIGSGSVVYSSVYIPSPRQLSMGKESALGPEVKLHIGKTIIGNKVTISQRTYLCSATHATTSLNTPFLAGTIIIEDFVWIAAEAFIMSNVTIRKGAIVGARSAVFKDVDEWSIVGGNPAREIKKRVIDEHP